MKRRSFLKTTLSAMLAIPMAIIGSKTVVAKKTESKPITRRIYERSEPNIKPMCEGQERSRPKLRYRIINDGFVKVSDYPKRYIGPPIYGNTGNIRIIKNEE